MIEKKDIIVEVSKDEMQVCINLPMYFEIESDSENEGVVHHYTTDEIYEALEQHNVCSGIDDELIKIIVDSALYEKDYVVAKGTPVIDGIDGYYEFLFNTELNRKPLIRPDGSADYYSIHLVELVKANQEIAVYHDPVDGQNGINVRGKVLQAKRGRVLPPIPGTGFFKVNNNHIYVSSIDGKIEYKNKRITIAPVYEVHGDVDMKTGNIDFRGDVIVHGSVRSGMTVNATGTCTLDGVLEGAKVYSDGDILIRGGIQGGGKATVRSNKDIQVGFIEYSNVFAEGNISVESIIDSNVVCHGKVKMSGIKSSIIGGSVYAIGGITVSIAGNKHNTHTALSAGQDLRIMKELLAVQNALQEDLSLVDKIDEALKICSEAQKIDLLRAKVTKKADVSKNMHKLDYYKILMARAEDATVIIKKETFPGVEVCINNIKAVISNHQDPVQFIEREGRIRMYSGIVEEN